MQQSISHGHVYYSAKVLLSMSVKLLVIGIIIAVVAAIIFYFRTKKVRDGLRSDLHKSTDRPDTTEL
jgi:ABC-type bacteriocin/lantibiotic exporter with double-glycine peptidase domain